MFRPPRILVGAISDRKRGTACSYRKIKTPSSQIRYKRRLKEKNNAIYRLRDLHYKYLDRVQRTETVFPNFELIATNFNYREAMDEKIIQQNTTILYDLKQT